MPFKSEIINFVYIHRSVVEMREYPSSKSKVVSQALFSEQIEVQQIKKGWSMVKTSDGYLGWIPSSAYTLRETPFEADLRTCRLASHLYELKDIEYGPLQTLPYHSRLQMLDTSDPRWTKVALPDNREGYIQKGDLLCEEMTKKKSDLPLFSQRFLGIPYTWGGRSSFGYDCSGFIQMLYQEIGIELKRDAYQQASDERFRVIDLSELEPGDLIFFGNCSKQIKHVALYLEANRFIHASSKENLPWIRISSLSDFEWSGRGDASYPYRLALQITPLLDTK